MRKPNFWDYHTNDSIHSAMRDYAASFDKSPLIATVMFSDGSEIIEEFEHATKEVFYRVFNKDEGLYSVDVHTSKYKEPFFGNKDMTSKELKDGYIQWLVKNNDGATFSVRWSK